MTDAEQFPAVGSVLLARDQLVVFQPEGTRYAMSLLTRSAYCGPLRQPIRCRIILAARKIYTVKSGGLFVAPISGPPRIIQGRIRVLQPREILVQAGVPIVVELPEEDAAYDLACGPLALGGIINILAFPGARVELPGSGD